MFGFFAPEAVKFLEMHSGMLTFLSTKKRSGGSNKVRLLVPQSPKPMPLDIPVFLIHARRSPTGHGYVCVGRVELDEQRYAKLESLVKTIPPHQEGIVICRRRVRYPARLKVVCRELPGFSAVTVDICELGVRLSTHGPVAQGTHARMTIDLDAGSVAPHLPISGQAVWCQPDPASKGGKGCVTAFEFCDVDAPTGEIVKSYLKSLAHRLDGDVMHRSISDGEMFIRGDDNVSKL